MDFRYDGDWTASSTFSRTRVAFPVGCGFN